MLTRLAALAVAAVVAQGSFAHAQDYPNRPVKIVVPFGAGGGTDALARFLARGLEQRLGQPFIIENRGGSGTTLGATAVANRDSLDNVGITESFVATPELVFDHATLDDSVSTCDADGALDLSESAGGRGWDQLRASTCALIRFQLAPEGPLLRAAATSAMPDSAHRNEVRKTLNQLIERVGHSIVDGMVDRSIRSIDPGVAAQLVVAGINATAETRRWIPGAAPEEAVRLYAPPLLCGLLAPTPPAGR